MRTNSKAATKPTSIGVKEEVKSEGNEIKEAFELFDANDGKINAREIRGAMQNIGYDENNPEIYQLVAELDTPLNAKNGGASFDDFCKTVNNRIPEKETNEQLRKVYNLFLENPDDRTTTLASIKRVADELGENFSEEEHNAMLTKASKAGPELTFDDFVAIMRFNIL